MMVTAISQRTLWPTTGCSAAATPSEKPIAAGRSQHTCPQTMGKAKQITLTQTVGSVFTEEKVHACTWTRVLGKPCLSRQAFIDQSKDLKVTAHKYVFTEVTHALKVEVGAHGKRPPSSLTTNDQAATVARDHDGAVLSDRHCIEVRVAWAFLQLPHS